MNSEMGVTTSGGHCDTQEKNYDRQKNQLGGNKVRKKKSGTPKHLLVNAVKHNTDCRAKLGRPSR